MSEEVQFSIQSINGRYNFVISGDMTCGRDANCEAIIPDTSLSRRHARFFVKDKALFVEDLGSTNGTFVNGEQLKTEPRLVRYNDIVRFDILEFKVFVELAAPEVAKAPRHVVASAVEKSEAQAPRSWAVNDGLGQGTVVMDLGANKRAAQEQGQDEPVLEASLLQSLDQPSLVGIRGADRGKTITLAINDTAMTVWQIGRNAEMDIVIELVDVISTNATYANGEKILTHYLSNGDTFSLGATEYLFRISSKTNFRPRKKAARVKSKRKIWIGVAASLLGSLIAIYFSLLS